MLTIKQLDYIHSGLIETRLSMIVNYKEVYYVPTSTQALQLSKI